LESEVSMRKSEYEKGNAELSVSLILVILGNLVHFRHSFITLYQTVMIRG